ncbi:MAG TPA: DinB family protein [Propionibacteriaceae bacterium]|nr:DinB family protein [Propionibacteriaceae bacterium]
MPGTAPAVSTEREALIAYLVQQREGLKNAAFGLTEEQIRAKPTRSDLSLGGLLKHAAVTERGWVSTMLGRPEEGDEQAYEDNFSLTESDTLVGLLATFDEVAEETEAAVQSLSDLSVCVQLPSAPWFPSNPEGYSARWILLHVIEELARHAGHADIIREHIDGATNYELLAAVEGWPETDWIKPWRPAADSTTLNSASATG